MEIKVRGLNKVRSKGRVYYYHRKTGTRITAAFGTAEFLQQVEALNRQGKPAEDAKPGTLGALIAAYKASPEFTDLSARTKLDYERVLDYLKPLKDYPLPRLSSAFIIGIRDRAYRKHKRRFANYVVQVLRLVLSWGKPRGFVKVNAAAEVPMIRRPKGLAKRNRPWTLAEVVAVWNAAPEELRVPIALGFYTGLREGDVLRLSWGAYDGSAINTNQGKTGDDHWLPAHSDLRAVLDAAKEKAKGRKVKSTTIVVGKRGRPFTENGFRARFFKLIRELRAAETVGPGLTFHGLRHTLATLIADEGFDNRSIMSMTGHRSESMVRHYTEAADRRRLAKAVVRKLERKKFGFAKPRAD